MKKSSKIILLFTISLFFIISTSTYAHQPRIVEGTETNITDPEISKAYYGILQGQPHTYILNATEDFDLYVNTLLPDISNQKKDITAEIFKNGESIATLEGPNFQWTKFFEPFGYDNYWMGPEYKARAEAGQYKIIVSSTNNDSKYSLAVGELEAFNLTESLHAIKIIPQLKKDFFNESPIQFILSPFGWGLILIMYLLGFIFGFLYRSILKKFAKSTARSANKNIKNSGRLIRLALSLGLLLLAITTTWSPLLLFFSGFALFEAIFSWCGFYAAIGKNSCPL